LGRCSLILVFVTGNGGTKGSIGFDPGAQGRYGSPGLFQALARQLTSSAGQNRVFGPI